ncbi:MAG: hypothetical protein ACOYNN_04240 [Terrimicrobiaceae bacterium]
MTREEVWQAYCARHPEFAKPDAPIRLTARGLRQLFDETWRHASQPPPERDIPEFFKSVFR